MVVTHEFSERIDIGLVWVYGTGQAVTLGFEEYSIAGANGYDEYWSNVTNYDKRNNFRMPSYHRLDVSVNFHKEKKWGMRTWSLGVYNAYSRLNPFFAYIDHHVDGRPYLNQVSLFPIIPSVSYSFKF